MQRRLVIALTCSALLHASMLLYPIAIGGHHAPTTASSTMTLSLHPAAASTQLAVRLVPSSALRAPPVQDASAAIAPSGLLTPPPRTEKIEAEPVVKSSFVEDPTPVAGEVDTTWYVAEEVEVRAEPLIVVIPRLPDEGNTKILVGRVILNVFVTEHGTTHHIDVVSSDPPGLGPAASGAFRDARWTPAVRGGRFVRSLKVIEVCYGDCSQLDQPVVKPIPLSQRRSGRP